MGGGNGAIPRHGRQRSRRQGPGKGRVHENEPCSRTMAARRARCFSSPWSRARGHSSPSAGFGASSHAAIRSSAGSRVRPSADETTNGRAIKPGSWSPVRRSAVDILGSRGSSPRTGCVKATIRSYSSFALGTSGTSRTYGPRRRPVRPDTSILRRAGNALVRRTGRRAVLDLDHGFEHRLYAGRVHAEARSVMAARRCWPTAAECPFGRRHTISRVTREDASRVHIRKVVTLRRSGAPRPAHLHAADALAPHRADEKPLGATVFVPKRC